MVTITRQNLKMGQWQVDNNNKYHKNTKYHIMLIITSELALISDSWDYSERFNKIRADLAKKKIFLKMGWVGGFYKFKDQIKPINFQQN